MLPNPRTEHEILAEIDRESSSFCFSIYLIPQLTMAHQPLRRRGSKDKGICDPSERIHQKDNVALVSCLCTVSSTCSHQHCILQKRRKLKPRRKGKRKKKKRRNQKPRRRRRRWRRRKRRKMIRRKRMPKRHKERRQQPEDIRSRILLACPCM